MDTSRTREKPARKSLFALGWMSHPAEYRSELVFSGFFVRHSPGCKIRAKSAASLIHCPNQVAVSFEVGQVVHFPAAVCANCPLRQRCTNSKTGRSVSVHPDEKLLQELRDRKLSPQGRAKLRERVAVEHTLAHIGQWQGDHARYLGLRKNLFDLRRMAVVHNLHVIARMPEPESDEVA